MTRPLWLIGTDIEHSLSPAMHNAALAAMGRPERYQLRPTPVDALDATLDEAERASAGVNLTAPFKVAAARRYHDVLDDDARRAAAVNTVVFDETKRARALNTDVAGLVRAWRRSAAPVEGRTLAVVGAGGAARAVVVAAHEAGARALVVHARRPEQAAALVALAATVGIEAVCADEPCGASMCVVAASAIDDPEALLRRALPGAGFVHDLRYGTSTHPLRTAALARRHLYSDGTGLLLFQGVLALEAFVGEPLSAAAFDAMRRAVSAR